MEKSTISQIPKFAIVLEVQVHPVILLRFWISGATQGIKLLPMEIWGPLLVTLLLW